MLLALQGVQLCRDYETYHSPSSSPIGHAICTWRASQRFGCRMACYVGHEALGCHNMNVITPLSCECDIALDATVHARGHQTARQLRSHEDSSIVRCWLNFHTSPSRPSQNKQTPNSELRIPYTVYLQNHGTLVPQAAV